MWLTIALKTFKFHDNFFLVLEDNISLTVPFNCLSEGMWTPLDMSWLHVLFMFQTDRRLAVGLSKQSWTNLDSNSKRKKKLSLSPSALWANTWMKFTGELNWKIILFGCKALEENWFLFAIRQLYWKDLSTQFQIQNLALMVYKSLNGLVPQ